MKHTKTHKLTSFFGMNSFRITSIATLLLLFFPLASKERKESYFLSEIEKQFRKHLENFTEVIPEITPNQSFTIDIANVEDNAPVGQVLAMDANSNITSFAIVSGNMNNFFAINNQGIITILDHHALIGEYSLEILVSNAMGLTDNEFVSVTITNNSTNLSPILTGGSFNISNAIPNAYVMGQITATDPDFEQGDAPLEYMIHHIEINGGSHTDAASQTIFSLNTQSGILQVNDANQIILGNQYVLHIKATDQDGGVGEAHYMVNVVAPANPILNAQTFNIVEGSSANTFVGHIIASDADGFIQNYKILSATFLKTSNPPPSDSYLDPAYNPAQVFNLNPNTGTLTVNNPKYLLNELGPIQLNVEVTDNDNKKTTANITVQVSDKIVSISQNHSLSWTTTQQHPLGHNEATGGVVNCKMYVFGGFGPNFAPKPDVHEYDHLANNWTRLANMPPMHTNSGSGGATHMGWTTDGVDMYIAAGYAANTAGTGQQFAAVRVYKYITASNSYVELPNLPIERSAGALQWLNGKLYYVGGTNRPRTEDQGDLLILDLNNLSTGWKYGSPMPNPRNHFGSTVFKNKLYVFGGQKEHDGELVPQDDVHAYDPLTNAWTHITDMPKAMNHIHCSVFAYGDYIFSVGGQVNHGTSAQRNIYAFHPDSNTWVEFTNLPVGRFAAVAGIIDSKLYVSGGNSSNTTYQAQLPNHFLLPNAGVCPTPAFTRYEAEYKAIKVEDVGSNGAVNVMNASIASNTQLIRLYDIGDKIKFDFNIPTTGNYRLKVRGRSGTNTNPTFYWNPLGYSFKLNQNTINFVGTNEITATSNSFENFGVMQSSILDLNSGNNTLEITAARAWLGVDYLEVEYLGGAPDTQAPTAPVLSLGTVTRTGVTLNWTASNDNVGVSAYEIFNGSNLVGTTSNLNFIVNNLNPNTAYSFTVKGKDAAGNSSVASNGVNTSTLPTPDTQAPTASVLSLGTVTQTSVALSWTASTDNVGVTAYDIFNGVNLAGTTSNLNFTVNGLTANTFYNLTVKAKDAAGNSSAASNTINATTLASLSAVRFEAETNFVIVSNVGTNGNIVVGNNNIASGGKDVRAYDIGDKFNINFNVAQSGQYRLKVNVRSGTNASPTTYWNPLGYSFKINNENLSFNPNLNSLSTASSTGYGSGGAYFGVMESGIVNLNAGTHALEISMTRTWLGIDYLDVEFLGGGTPDTEAPTAPVLSLGTVTANSVALNWSGATDNVVVTAYEVYQGANLVTTTSNTNFTATGLSANTAYTFTVKAKDAAGNTSPSSNVINATTSAPPTSVRFEAETNFTIVSNVGTNGNIVIGNNNIASAGKDLRAYDIGDKFNINFTVPQTGQYRLKVNARSGTIASPQLYWNPLGYSFRLNNTPTTFTPNPSTVSTTATTAYGAVGAHFGNVESGIVNLNVGANVLEITMTRTWLGVDYLDVEFVGSGVANQTESEIQVSKTVTLVQDISKLYPNPAGGEDVYVEFSGDVDGKIEYNILDAQGKVFTKQIITLDEPQYVIKIAIANFRLSQGVYYIYLKGDKLQERIIRFVKN